MRSLVLEAPERLAWHRVPEPQRRHEREAIVRPLAVAICDLDWPMIFGRAPFPLPIHIGHPCVAEVVEGPEGFAPGVQGSSSAAGEPLHLYQPRLRQTRKPVRRAG